MATLGLIALLFACFITGNHANHLERSIVGGANATEGQFPHQVAMHAIKFAQIIFCGGSIISANYILTAAHCVNGAEVTAVFVGSTKTTEGKAVDVANVIVHEKYTKFPVPANDIALLKLVQPLEFTKTVRAIKLATKPPAVGTTAVISGWGYLSFETMETPETLQWVTMETVPSSECNRDKDILCLSTKPGHGACLGDSGGPAVNDDELVGVCSHGVPCAKGYPDRYTSVYHYLDWIKKHSDL